MFSNYLAIDPSLWWDNRKLEKESEQILANATQFKNKSLFVAMANTLKEGMTIKELVTDTTEAMEHPKTIFQFSEKVKTLKSVEFNFESKYYEHDDHSSLPLIAEYDALRWMFSWFRLKGLEKYFWDKETKSTDLISELLNHYHNVSGHFGYEVLPPEDYVNEIGAWFLIDPKMKEKAFALFELNTKNYPKSARAFNSMGDYYLSQKDTAQAISYFKKSLSINVVSATKEKLQKLEKEKL